MSEAVGVICNEGVCTELDPATALVIIALDSLVNELNKKEPFGPNNEIVKAIKDAQKAILNGDVKNNDIVKALASAWSDLTNGLGPNNDIRKALEAIGIKF